MKSGNFRGRCYGSPLLQHRQEIIFFNGLAETKALPIPVPTSKEQYHLYFRLDQECGQNPVLNMLMASKKRTNLLRYVL